MFELIAYDIQSHVSTIVSQGSSLTSLKSLAPDVKRWTAHRDENKIVRELTGLAVGQVVYTIRHNPFAGIRFYTA